VFRRLSSASSESQDSLKAIPVRQVLVQREELIDLSDKESLHRFGSAVDFREGGVAMPLLRHRFQDIKIVRRL